MPEVLMKHINKSCECSDCDEFMTSQMDNNLRINYIIDDVIYTLVQYGIDQHLMEESDRQYSLNRIIALLHKDELLPFGQAVAYTYVSDLLEMILIYACEQGIIETTQASKDRFDSELMNTLLARPSTIQKRFYAHYQESPRVATDAYYHSAKASNYIRMNRIDKNYVYQANSEYGDIDITINLSKPEKDPRDIAAAKKSSSTYPPCVLCKENEGYYGNSSFDGRSNHRIIPITLQDTPWFLQYSPYVYYNEHCIVVNKEHVPMKISRNTFARLLAFVQQFPHYFLGSNADLPIVGGSILSHDHFQGGCYEFAMAKAACEASYAVFEGGELARVAWPMSVLRLRSTSQEKLVEAANHIYEKWQQYSDIDANIIAFTDGIPHNTITPIARKRNEKFELDLVLRNNRTSETYPMGIFHPHEHIHHIKKENIGLIEVMGLAVLPGRLLQELELIKVYLLKGGKPADNLSIHLEWMADMQKRYTFTKENIESILQAEIASIFMEGLEHCGVFKRTEEGFMRFNAFIASLTL